MVKDADALIIRTRTRCNRELLEGSKVKFIATATIGFDHIDAEYCREADITWTNAPGCNSASVAQYLQSSLILLQTLKGINLPEVTIGIIGVGNVGSKVAKVAQELGMRVLLNDLPREDKEGKQGFSSLQTLAEECDILTFHVPLYKEGRYKTCHLADDAFFQSLKRKPVIINTSRGEIIETGALLNALDTGLVSDAIIDVWENEPAINLTLLDKVFLGTPHIAGYSADGKPMQPACHWIPYAGISIYRQTIRLFLLPQANHALQQIPYRPPIYKCTIPDKTAMHSKRIRSYLRSYGETIL